jgi:hypothetical protein
MALTLYNRVMRASSELPGGYGFDLRQRRACSALPQSYYEDAYNRSEQSAIRRELSSNVRTETLSRVVNEIPPTLLDHALFRAQQLRDIPRRSEVSRFVNGFSRNDGIVHTKITIRHRDDFWKKKYEQDIVNAKPTYVIRPRVVVQRPLYITTPPLPPTPIYIPVTRYIERVPRIRETTTTTRYTTRFYRPARIYSSSYWGSSTIPSTTSLLSYRYAY